MMPMGRLEGKVVIVTGATSGIGRGCAISMAEEGAKIVATGRNKERGQITVDQISRRGGECIFVRQDVTQEDDWRRVMDATLDAYGELHVLLNNAGDAIVGPLDKLTLDDLKFLIRVDVEGPFLGIKYAWPHLVAAGGGAIMNMSSVCGQKAVPGGVAYCPAKGALTSLTKAAAAEGAPVKIRANSIHPGLIWTEGVVDVMGPNVEEYKPRMIERVPMGEWGEPKHVGAVAVWLASDAASHVTGIEINVDGGQFVK